MGRRKLPRSTSQRAFRRLQRENEWSIEEKEALLAAMLTHGVSKFDKLRAAVPSRSVAEIQNFLKSRKREGLWHPRNLDANSPLEEWLKKLHARDVGGALNVDGSRVLCPLLLMLADHERHPPPESCDGVDYRELYTYLSQLLAGIHPKKISQPSANLLYKSCLWLVDTIVKNDMTQYKSFIARISGVRKERLKYVYGCNEKANVPQASPLSPLFQQQDFNPYDVFEHLLKMDPNLLADWKD